MKHTIRVGIVGAGFGALVHAPAFRAHERFELVAIASPSHASEEAKKQGIPNAFVSCEEMLDGIELDLVSIASPPFMHHRDASTALAAGKHILCEKPFALNLAQAHDLAARAQSAGTVCAIAFEFRYATSILAMRELVVNKHLGAPRQIEITHFGSTLRASGDRPNSWWFDRSRGGGVANAYMPHLFDLASYLVGHTPQSTLGFLRTANPLRRSKEETFTSTVGDGAFALLDFGEGVAATITSDLTHAVNSALVAVHGEHRTIVSSGKTVHDMTTFLVDEEETAELDLRANPHAKRAITHPSIPLFLSLLDDLAQAIDGKPSTVPTFADGLAVQQCLEAIGYSVPAAGP
jgi:predicted dehydrogenase